MNEKPRAIPSDKWTNRRIVVFVSLIWAAFEVHRVIGMTMPNETIVWSLLMFMGAIIGSYVFGACWDFKNRLSAGKS